ncbi:potential E3 ubiquitin-protein ligase ariadne-2-like isoform X2 [Watersipora subatra]|uniref:potential E3 ubiquitin-protein ligase ariadne-2-like isoform X2 n=1 Tax=Watersipora subatra TaxID=2589382 RepID=UPI00355AE471
MSQSDDSQESYYDYGEYDTEDGMDGISDNGDDVIDDPERFEHKVCSIAEITQLINEAVARIQTNLQIQSALAKILLHQMNYAIEDIQTRYRLEPEKLLVESRIRSTYSPLPSSREDNCDVCLSEPRSRKAAGCGHYFCQTCWSNYIEIQLDAGHSADMECMAVDCRVILSEDMVLDLLSRLEQREKYLRLSFESHVNHPQLRFCPGPGCKLIIYAKERKAGKATCPNCDISFCFSCGIDYHAPTSCAFIHKWLTKCRDDSETANYISANTKDCPNCHVCIEKSGGCNHMRCRSCGHDFCWVCKGAWRIHAGEYYQCSRYEEDPEAAKGHQVAQNEARVALNRYLHYFTRWDNHSKSLELEVEESRTIRHQIEAKIQKNEGTWIDWEYLVKATTLLRKCRYTLQYTYPYAYFLKSTDSLKQLFEMLQGKLEAEVENLSWNLQRAEMTDRGELENQMDIAEKMRKNLLKELPTTTEHYSTSV